MVFWMAHWSMHHRFVAASACKRRRATVFNQILGRIGTFPGSGWWGVLPRVGAATRSRNILFALTLFRGDRCNHSSAKGKVRDDGSSSSWAASSMNKRGKRIITNILLSFGSVWSNHCIGGFLWNRQQEVCCRALATCRES